VSTERSPVSLLLPIQRDVHGIPDRSAFPYVHGLYGFNGIYLKKQTLSEVSDQITLVFAQVLDPFICSSSAACSRRKFILSWPAPSI
jgi:hypothetical protein